MADFKFDENASLKQFSPKTLKKGEPVQDISTPFLAFLFLLPILAFLEIHKK